MYRAIRPAAGMLILSVVLTPLARAEGVRIGDVSQVLVSASSVGTGVQLRNISQASNLVNASRPVAQNQSNGQNGNGTKGDDVTAASGATTTVVIQDPSTPSIETIELGEVTGTICDCGEIAIPGGAGFPLFPLLALAALPLAFLSFGDDEATLANVIQPPAPAMPTPNIPAPATPTLPPMPTPPPTTPIPEPATLLLLGTGLAGLFALTCRRRRSQASCGQTSDSIEEGE